MKKVGRKRRKVEERKKAKKEDVREQMKFSLSVSQSKERIRKRPHLSAGADEKVLSQVGGRKRKYERGEIADASRLQRGEEEERRTTKKEEASTTSAQVKERKKRVPDRRNNQDSVLVRLNKPTDKCSTNGRPRG